MEITVGPINLYVFNLLSTFFPRNNIFRKYLRGLIIIIKIWQCRSLEQLSKIK